MTTYFKFKSPFYFISAALVLLAICTQANAEIYKTIDAEGRVTYSNVKIKGAKKLDLEPADTSFGTGGNNNEGTTKRAPAARTATPASFPKVDAGTQNQRDGKRKDILQSELDAERKALDDAKKAYAEGESNPEVFRTPTGQVRRNVPKFQEKMKDLQANVDAHQRNIELLEKEISGI